MVGLGVGRVGVGRFGVPGFPRYSHWGCWDKGKGMPMGYGSPYGGKPYYEPAGEFADRAGGELAKGRGGAGDVWGFGLFLGWSLDYGCSSFISAAFLQRPANRRTLVFVSGFVLCP